jgi:type II secretion system protein N
VNPDGKAAKALKGLGYSFFFSAMLLFFFVMTFPDEAARDWAEVQGSNFLGSPVQIEKAELTGLIGLNAEGIILRLKKIEDEKPGVRTSEGKKKKPLPPPRLIEINRLNIDASPFSMLFSDALEFTFTGEVQGGEVSDGLITIDTEKQTKTLRIGSIEDVRLGAERFLQGVVGLDLQGILSGSVAVSLGKSASNIQDGTIDLTLSDAQVVKPSFKHKSMGVIGLTDTTVGSLRIRAVVKPLTELPGSNKRRNRKSKNSMVIHFEELSSDSPELAFKTEDKSAIHFDPERSIGDATLDLHFAVFVKEAYLEKEGENVEGAVGKHNKIISQAARMRLIPTLARVYRKGVFGVMCTGKMSKPDCSFKRTKLKFEDKKKARKKPTSVSRRDAKKRKKRASPPPSTRAPLRKNSASTNSRSGTPVPTANNARRESSRGVTGRSPSANTIPPSRTERPVRKMAPLDRNLIPGARANVTSTTRRTQPSLREPQAEEEETEEEEEEESSDDDEGEEEDEDDEGDNDDDDEGNEEGEDE